MVTQHATNYLEILMLCPKLWAHLLGWSLLSAIWDGKEVNCSWQQNKKWSGIDLREITKVQSSQTSKTIQGELQTKYNVGEMWESFHFLNFKKFRDLFTHEHNTLVHVWQF